MQTCSVGTMMIQVNSEMDGRTKSLMQLELKTAILWQFNVTGNTKMYVGFPIKNSRQIFVSPQYKISQKSVQWEPS
jgi:hypothetical protein